MGTFAALDPPLDFGSVVFIELPNSQILGLSCSDWAVDPSISTYPEGAEEIFEARGQFFRSFDWNGCAKAGWSAMSSLSVAGCQQQFVGKQEVDYSAKRTVFHVYIVMRTDLANYGKLEAEGE